MFTFKLYHSVVHQKETGTHYEVYGCERYVVLCYDYETQTQTFHLWSGASERRLTLHEGQSLFIENGLGKTIANLSVPRRPGAKTKTV